MNRVKKTVIRKFPVEGKRLKNGILIKNLQTGAVMRVTVRRGRGQGVVVVSIDADNRLVVVPEENGVEEWDAQRVQPGTIAEESAGIPRRAPVC